MISWRHKLGMAGVGAIVLALLSYKFWRDEFGGDLGDHVSKPAQERPDALSISPQSQAYEVFEEEIQLNYTFTIVNRGLQPIAITKLVAGCSCNVATLSADRIAPGKCVELKVTYNAAGLFDELARRTITIYTDASAEPLTCTVGGRRIRRFNINPSGVNFGKIIVGESPSARVTIESTASELQFMPEKMIVNSPWVTGKIVELSRSALGKPSLTVELSVRGDAPAGQISANVFVPRVENDRIGPSIPVNVEIVGPVVANPAQCFFGVVAAGSRHSSTIRLVPARAEAVDAIRVVSVSTTAPQSGILVETSQTSPSEICIHLDASNLPTGRLEQSAIVTFMYKGKNSSLSVPISCLITK